VYLQAFLNSAADGGEWSTSRPGGFTPRERASKSAWTLWRKINFCSCQISKTHCLARSLATILTELYSLQLNMYTPTKLLVVSLSS
jgi:hypothetical protein